jgi:hypothetical protein
MHVFTWGGLQRRYLALTRSSIMLIVLGWVGGCCKLLSCLKFARLTKASVLVSFDGCDDECVLGFVLDSVHPGLRCSLEHLRVHSLELRLFLIDRATRSCR